VSDYVLWGGWSHPIGCHSLLVAVQKKGLKSCAYSFACLLRFMRVMMMKSPCMQSRCSQPRRSGMALSLAARCCNEQRCTHLGVPADPVVEPRPVRCFVLRPLAVTPCPQLVVLWQ
jgi:hypothetical protein